MLEIGIEHYLTVAAMLFTLGVFGIFLNRKNVIIILLSIELILLAVNLNLVAFSSYMGDMVGQVFGQGAACQARAAVDDDAAAATDTGPTHKIKLQGRILLFADFVQCDEQGHGIRFLQFEGLQVGLAVRVVGVVPQYLDVQGSGQLF